MGLLYKDRLDSRIPSEMYDAKYRELSGERKALEEGVVTHSSGAHKSQEVGMAVFEMSQGGRTAYANADTDQKRDLLQLVFTGMTLDNGVLTVEYAEAFAVLAKAVGATNGSKNAEKQLLGIPIFGLAESGSGKQKHHEVVYFVPFGGMRGTPSEPQSVLWILRKGWTATIFRFESRLGSDLQSIA